MILGTESWCHNQDLGDVFLVPIGYGLTIGDINVDMKKPTACTAVRVNTVIEQC